MTMKFKVPSMVCEGCVTAVKDAITGHEPNAEVEVNLDTKQVTVDTEASEESIKQVITAIGHDVE